MQHHKNTSHVIICVDDNQYRKKEWHSDKHFSGSIADLKCLIVSAFINLITAAALLSLLEQLLCLFLHAQMDLKASRRSGNLLWNSIHPVHVLTHCLPAVQAPPLSWSIDEAVPSSYYAVAIETDISHCPPTHTHTLTHVRAGDGFWVSPNRCCCYVIPSSSPLPLPRRSPLCFVFRHPSPHSPGEAPCLCNRLCVLLLQSIQGTVPGTKCSALWVKNKRGGRVNGGKEHFRCCSYSGFCLIWV